MSRRELSPQAELPRSHFFLTISRGELWEERRRLADLVAMGATYKDAARTLGISPATVRNQLHSAYAKLGIPGRRQLAAALAR